MASIPTWFDESAYLTNKLDQLKSVEPNVAWNESTLKAAIAGAGYTPFEHFVAFGAAEHISPNAQFNVAEYLAAKAAQMNANLKEGETPWTEASIAKAIKDAGMTEWSHYQQFGSAEGVNPSNSFDAAAYCAAKAAIMGGEWTAASIAKAIADAGMSVLEHYEMYKGAGADEVAADAMFPIAPADKVTPSITFDPYQPENVGSSFALTDKDDTFNGTANSDTITGRLEHLGGRDSIIDTNANDQDHMILDAGMSANVAANGATVKGIENITINTAAVRDLTVDVAGFEGMQTLRVKPTADSFANLTVNGLTKATVDAATASSVTLAGKVSSTTDDVVVKLNNAAVNVTNDSTNAIETLTISSDVATKVTLTEESTNKTTIKTAGDGDMTLSMDVANFTSATGDTIVKGNAGKLAVELTDSAATVDTTKIAAGVDSITFVATTAGSTVTANNGQNFILKDASIFTFNMATTNTASNDSVNVALADGKTYTVKTGDLLENITVNAAKGNTITALSGGTVADTATLTGSDTLGLGAVTGFKTLDASAFSGTLNATAALNDLNILGGTGTNTVTLAATAASDTTFYKGTGEGVDNVTLTGADISGTVVVDAGAGADTVTLAASSEIVKVASIDLGAGANTFVANTDVTGTLLVKGGADVDTFDLTAITVGATGNATIDAGAGNDVITLTKVDATSGGTLTINAGDGNDTISVGSAATAGFTIDAGAGDDTITLASQATGAYTVNGGEGNDTVVLTATTAVDYSDVTFSGIESFKLGGNTTLSAKAFADGASVAKSAGVATATLTVNAEASGADVINLSNVAKGIDTTINVGHDDSFTALTGSQNTDTLAINGSQAVTLNLAKAAISNIEAISFGSDAVDALTIGNFTGTDTLSVTFDTTQSTAGDSLTIDLTAAFTSVSSIGDVKAAGQYFVDNISNPTSVVYMDDNHQLITVSLTGVASNGVVGTTGDLVITGANS